MGRHDDAVGALRSGALAAGIDSRVGARAYEWAFGIALAVEVLLVGLFAAAWWLGAIASFSVLLWFAALLAMASLILIGVMLRESAHPWPAVLLLVAVALPAGASCLVNLLFVLASR